MGEIKGLDDFIKEVIKLSAQFEEGQKLWYRGHGSSSEFKLVPSLYREVLDPQQERSAHVLRPNQIFNIERGIDLSFSRQATIFLSRNGIKNTEMNRYFLKQHYKVKTRLLDWTESALVALYFAIYDPKHMGKDAEVWVLLPFKLNSFSIQKLAKDSPSEKAMMIFSSVDKFDAEGPLFRDRKRFSINQLLRKYYQLDVAEDEEMYPIALYPTFLDDRMRAQQSCFTFFGNMFNGLDSAKHKDEFLFSIKIPSLSKSKILKELQLLGFTNFSVYPDLDGLGHSINDEYNKRFEQEALEEHRAMNSYHLSQSGLVEP